MDFRKLNEWRKIALDYLYNYPHKFDNNARHFFNSQIESAYSHKDIDELTRIAIILRDETHHKKTSFENEEKIKTKFVPFKKLTGQTTTHPIEKKIDIWDADNQLVDRDLSRKKKIKKPRSKRKKCKCK